MKSFLKKGSFILLSAAGFYFAATRAFEIFETMRRPKLTYSVTTIEAPMFLGGVAFNYYIKIFRFQNIGLRTADDVRVEATVEKPWIANSCKVGQIAEGVVLQEAKGGGLEIRAQDMLSYTWQGVFDSELVAIESIGKFRNEKTEGNAILRAESRDTAIAYKDRLHPGESGELIFRTFFSEPQVSRLNFHSIQGVGSRDDKATFSYLPMVNSVLVFALGVIAFVLGAPWKYFGLAGGLAVPGIMGREGKGKSMALGKVDDEDRSQSSEAIK